MSRPMLSLKAPITRWRVETAQMVRMPQEVEALSLEVLREQLQCYADTYRTRPGFPPLGLLTFRYETDNRLRVKVVHAYFTGRDRKLKRFARLRRT